MDTLYYYYYLTYKKYCNEETSHLYATWVLGASVGFWAVGISVSALLYFFCYPITVASRCVIFAIIMGIVHYYFMKNNRNLRIVKTKPQFFNSHQKSYIITVLFFLALTESRLIE